MAITALALASLALMATTLGLYFMSNDTKTEETYFRQFIKHNQKYNKRHSNQDDINFRYAIYAMKMKMIEAHNASGKSFTMAENKFTDLTFEEFKSKYLSKQILHNQTTSVNKGVMESDHKDWVLDGMVSRVKDQADCGSCWAFSATGSLESAYAIKGEKIEVSEQELVDCSGKYGNNGCDGGLMSNAFKYIMHNQISTEKDYVYTAEDGKCKAKKYKTKYSLKGFASIDPVDVTGLVAGIKIQPVSVAIEVQEDFMNYSSGIYTNDECGDSLNHGVLAAGYYNDVEVPYFVVKNSWGGDWGDKGYIKMAIAEGSGTCGIANSWDAIPQL